MSIINASIGNSVAFYNILLLEMSDPYTGGNPASILEITQSVVINKPTYVNISNTISFAESITRTDERHLIDYIQFGQYAGKLLGFFFVGNSLQFSHAARVNIVEEVSDTLIFNQIVENTRSFPQIISLVQTLTFVKIKTVSITSAITLSSGSSGFLDNKPSIILATVPVITSSNFNVTLTAGNGKVVLLRSPKIGDQDSTAYMMINRRTRGGDLNIFRDSQWPKTEIIKYKFEDVTEYKAKQLLDFIQLTLGEDITLTDYLGNNVIGFIKNSDAVMEQVYRSQDYYCGANFSVDMELQV